MKKIKRQFILTIMVDEDTVKMKYPNYQFNYDNPNQLIKSVVNDVKFIGGVDMSKKGMKEFGYSINVEPAIEIISNSTRVLIPKSTKRLPNDIRADLDAQDPKWGEYKI